MTEPKRVQMTRNKPWRQDHPDAVIVDRRTKWGNPFRVAHDRPYQYVIDENDVTYSPCDMTATERAVQLYRWDLTNNLSTIPTVGEVRAELRGKDLACWCPLEDEHGNRVPCHADVLLELANTPETPDEL